MNLSRRAKILLSLLLILFISIPITLGILQKPQNDQSNAAATTTLSLVPQPGPANSITKNVGDSIPVDVTLNPGSNIVQVLRMEISYPANKLQPDPNQDFFTLTQQPPHTPHFSSDIQQATTGNGKVLIVLTTEDSPSNAIRSPITVGTFHFKAIQSTGSNTPAEVTFTSQTTISSIASADSVKENVLKNSVPAEITINEVNTPPPGPQPGTTLSFTLLLDGIGKAGDYRNPGTNSLSNQDPKSRRTISMNVSVYDASNSTHLAANGTGQFSYQIPGNDIDDNIVGTFRGSVTLNNALLVGQQYTVKIQGTPYLRKALKNVVITNNSSLTIPPLTLVSGDVTGDNMINADDYSVLLDCGFGALNPLPMTNPSSQYTSQDCRNHQVGNNVDLNDDGTVDAYDYNLFIRELPVGNGD